MHHESMQVAFFLSGLKPSSPFPFSRWITQILPTTSADEKKTFSLHVPSLQPHRQGDQVPIRFYVPPAPKTIKGKVPVVVWMHGGGFVFGSVSDASSDRTARAIADALDVYVIAVDYSLAPEHPFPDGLEDCYAVLAQLEEGNADWIVGRGKFSHIPPISRSHVFVGGVGAGGNLALQSTLLWEDRRLSNKEPLPSLLPQYHSHSGKLQILGGFLMTPDLMMVPSSPHYYKSELILMHDTSDMLRRLYLNVSTEEEATRLMLDPFVGTTNTMEAIAKLKTRFELFSMTPCLYHEDIKDFHKNVTEGYGGDCALMSYFQSVQGEIFLRKDSHSSFIHRFWNLVDSTIPEFYK